MKKLFALAILAALLISAPPAFAQGDESFTISLSRDIGYGGFENDIEGLFSFHAQGPENFVRVDFYIDEELVASDETAPFSYQFSTKAYLPGEHRLYAIGFTADGQELRSNEIVRVFLSAQEARTKVVGLIFPLLGIILLILVVVTVIPLAFSRGKPQLSKYGLSGGAVCPKCGLPFPIHFLSFHAGAKNLERCPHCGKWVWVRKASKEDLAAAEARWIGDDKITNSESKEDRLRRQIDDSRYEE